jgi:hypothetical protein
LLPGKGAKCLSEPEYLKNEWCGGRWGTHYCGHPANGRGQTRVESNPQRRALEEQSQEQAEDTGGKDSEIPRACVVARGVLVRLTRPSRGLVLRCMLRGGSALWRVAEQVQGSEDPVAEEQRADE